MARIGRRLLAWDAPPETELRESAEQEDRVNRAIARLAAYRARVEEEARHQPRGDDERDRR